MGNVCKKCIRTGRVPNDLSKPLLRQDDTTAAVDSCSQHQTTDLSPAQVADSEVDLVPSESNQTNLPKVKDECRPAHSQTTSFMQTGSPSERSTTIHTELDDNEFANVVLFLKKLDPKHIKQLGSLLGLKYYSMDKMIDLPDDMVKAWLRKEDNVTKTCGEFLTWEVLVGNLRRMGQNGVADEIAKDKCQQTVSPAKGNAHASSKLMECEEKLSKKTKELKEAKKQPTQSDTSQKFEKEVTEEVPPAQAEMLTFRPKCNDSSKLIECEEMLSEKTKELKEAKKQQTVTSQKFEREVSEEVPPAQAKIVTLPKVNTDELEAILKYAKRLRAIYSNHTMPDYLKAYQFSNESLVELALVQQQQLSRKDIDEFACRTVNQDGGDIDMKKSPLQMEDLIKRFESGSLAKCILFQGGPGVGKTTLAWKLCREWVPGKYSLVVFVPLRRKEIHEAKQLSDLLCVGNVDRKTCFTIAKELQENQDDIKVLLVLDGYDQLPLAMQRKSVVAQIVSGELLPDVHVLVTSRPSCCDMLHEVCSQRIGFQHIKVLGFTHSKINDYIEQNVDSKLLKSFEKYQIRSMLYNPQQCALMVEVCKKYLLLKEGSTLPATRTKLFERNILSLMTLIQEDSLGSLQNLHPILHKKFSNLCKLAFHGIVKQQIIFNSVHHDDVQELGLLVQEPDIFSPMSTSKMFSFLHLTIQEFCAAYYLSLLTEKERGEILLKYISKGHFREVIIFLCGVCENPSTIINTIYEHAPQYEDKFSHGDKRVDTRFLLHCAFESQNDYGITSLMKKLKSCIDLKDEDLSPSDLSLVGFIMIKTQSVLSIKKLDLSRCLCGTDGIQALFYQLQLKHSISIEELFLPVNSIGDDGAKCLAHGLKCCPNLKFLNLSENSIGDDGAKCLANGLQHCPSLRLLQ